MALVLFPNNKEGVAVETFKNIPIKEFSFKVFLDDKSVVLTLIYQHKTLWNICYTANISRSTCPYSAWMQLLFVLSGCSYTGISVWCTLLMSQLSSSLLAGLHHLAFFSYSSLIILFTFHNIFCHFNFPILVIIRHLETCFSFTLSYLLISSQNKHTYSLSKYLFMKRPAGLCAWTGK